jgi:trans-aconitate 2-methyltransferase
MWDPAQYDVYNDERSRPFHDLVSRLRSSQPAVVVDLGCGDGALTATLADRWPAATVVGVDSSTEMLAVAAGRAIPGRLQFRRGTIEAWQPDQPVDVLVSNAALHWVPGHAGLLDRLVGALQAGGELAFQVPGNFDEPSHVLLADLRQSPRWRGRLSGAASRAPAVLQPAEYMHRLADLGCSVDAWETTYLHVLSGPDPVLEWVRGTALRPVRAALTPAEAAEFEAEYGARLREAYPPTPHGTVLPFRRIFVVARRLNQPGSVSRP